MSSNQNHKNDLFSRRVDKILPTMKGLRSLTSKRKIRLYQGFDPTGYRLHLGHTIGLRKLMEFANLGHEVIFLFGTGTVLAGDPSQRYEARKRIAAEQIEHNIQTWKDQVMPIVDFNKVRMMYNAEWLLKLNLADIIEIASNISAVQLFKRDMFQRRLKQGDTIWMHETLYPLLQGYDSVAMDVDLEIGGTDQEFNMLIGRELLQKMKSKEKFVLTVPMILGTDGKQMSKSSGNCIWLDDSADDMYGKLMSIPDEQITPYMELLTDIPLEEIKTNSSQALQNKKRLALDVTTQFHGQPKAFAAHTQFKNVVQKKKIPQKLEEFLLKHISIDDTIVDVLVKTKCVPTRSAAKRLTRQGGVEVDGIKITDPTKKIARTKNSILKAGKRKYIKFI